MTNPHEIASAARRLRLPALRKMAVLLALGFVMTTFLLGASTEEAPAQNSWENQVIDLINDHRASIGRAPLATSSSISAGARTWSQQMLQDKWMRHDPNKPSNLAENVAYAAGPAGQKVGVSWSTAAGPLPRYCTSSMDRTRPEFLVCQWLSSTAGHRSAIESASYRQIGVGVAQGSDPRFGMRTYSTARFSASAPEPTAAPVPVATFTSPGNNARLCSGQKISWSGPNSGQFRLHLGTSRSGSQVMNTSTGAKELRAAPLPADRTIYATLMYRPNDGKWVTTAQRTFAPCANPVELNTTSRLCSGDVISWSGPNSGRYKVRIGTTYDGTQAMNKGASRRYVDAAPNLPTGRDLYVSLRHRGSDGVWTLQDTAVFQECSKPIEIMTPTDLARLCDNDLVDWVGRSSGRYRIRVGTSPDGTEVLNESTVATKYNVRDIRSTSGRLYVSLRHQTVDGGPWALHYVIELRSC